MKFPELLLPDSEEELELPSGRVLKIPKAKRSFQLWNGAALADTYGNKPVVDISGKPYFAELAVLKFLSDSGWEGVWVDTYRNAYRTQYWPKNDVRLPASQEALLQEIYSIAESTKGCWDVYGWQGNDVLFIELKRKSRDRIRASQLHWLEAAVKTGLPIQSFLIVEWTTA